MRTLTYKGFGFDNNLFVGFNLLVDKNVSAKIIVTLYGDAVVLDTIENDDNTESIAYTDGSETLLGYFPYTLYDGEQHINCYFDTVEKAVVIIKKIVTELRNYWKSQKAEYKACTVALNGLTVADCIPENSDDFEIELIQRAQRKRIKR